MSENTTNNKRIAQNTLFLYLRMVIVLFVSLYTTRIVLRNLGVEDYGIYNVVCGFVTMFSFLNSTLSSSINRFYNFELGQHSENGVNDVYNNAMRIQICLALVLMIIVEAVGIWYLNTKMVIPEEKLSTANWIFQFSLVSLVFTILQAPYIAAILAYERMNFYAFVSIVDVFLKLGIAFVVNIVPTDKLWLYGLLIMFISVINFSLYSSYKSLNFKNLHLVKTINKKMFKSMLSFSGWSFLNPLAYTGRSQGCTLVLNFFFGPVINAAYAITTQVSSAIDSFSLSVSVAARPQLIQSYSSGEFQRSERLFFSTSKIMFSLISMLTLPLAFNMDFILGIWLGNNVPNFTTEFCVWILMVKLVDSLNPSCTNLILATGKIRLYMNMSSILIFSVVPISIVLFNFIDSPILLFIIMLCSTILNQVSSVLILHHVFSDISIRKYLKDIALRCIILFTITYMTIRMINEIFNLLNWISLIVDVLVSLIVTLLIAYTIVLSKRERAVLKSILYKYIKVTP